MIAGRVLLAVAILLASLDAAAHTRSQSYSSWSIDGAVLVGVFQVDARRVTQLGTEAESGDLEHVLAAHLAATVSAAQAGTRCAAHEPLALAAARGDVRVELSFRCPRPIEAAPATVVMGAFFDASPSHVHYARVARPGGQAQEVLVTVREQSFVISAASAAPTDFAAFFRLGLAHVLSGADHLAFLLALTLLAASFGRAAWAATGFTLGHSLTLGLVAVGRLSPSVPAVEALIGFTVAFAAGEAYVSRPGRPTRTGAILLAAIAAGPLAARLLGVSPLPWIVAAGTAVFAACAGGLGGDASRRLAPLLAAAFGLAHGAGFAGALLELDIPRDRLLGALLGFNLGVEAAQLLALLGVAALAFATRRIPAVGRARALDYVTAGLFALGTYWYVGRSLALG